MSFRENLLHLRAAHNMTQEQLAVLLGVSRQSVTKWESDKSYPEMDKLIALCQIFDCTLDELVQGDLTDREPVPSASAAAQAKPSDVFGYDEHMRSFADHIAGGVTCIIFGVALSVMFFSFVNLAEQFASIQLAENLSTALSLLCIFAGVGLGLALIIPASMEHSQFVRQHPYLEDFYTEEEKSAARHAFVSQLISGIAFIFVGVLIVILLDSTSLEESVGVPCMLACVAFGVGLIIRGSMTLSRTNIAAYNQSAGEVLTAHEIEASSLSPEQKQVAMKEHKSDKRIGSLCGIIMIVATIAGLVQLFVPEYHSPLFWLAWPIGGLLCGIVSLLIKGFARD